MRIIKHHLQFLRPAGTSRGTLLSKPSYFIQHEGKWGECSIIPGLSPETLSDLDAICHLHSYQELLPFAKDYPALNFATEMISIGLRDIPFSRQEQAISINGLLWMGSKDYLSQQIRDLLSKDFRCLKMKIGSLDLETELGILESIRKIASPAELQLRVDANGAFKPDSVMNTLGALEPFGLHSIEQPIAPRQEEHLQQLCRESPIPIALDEELINRREDSKTELLSFIKPQYIVLKPSLLGGLAEADQWIESASSLDIQWWATSALESNLGLYHIAQWLSEKEIPEGLFQGLGTGRLFSNNIPSPLYLEGDQLRCRGDHFWNFGVLED